MLFQSRWRNAAYIVRPTRRSSDMGIITIHPGLRAQFTGENRIFDSEESAKKYGWSEEERIQVEKHLVKHNDFGNGIYFAAGEEVPDYLTEFVKPDKKRIKNPCTYVKVKDGVVNQCPEEAMVGSNRCAEHREDSVRVTKGLLSAGEL